METDGTTVTVGNHDFIVSVGHTYFNHTVIFADGDGVHTILTRTRILFEQCLLNDTVLRTEEYIVTIDEFRVVQILHTQVSRYHIVCLNVQQVLDGTSLRSFVAFRNFIYLEPVALTLLREEQKRIVHSSRIDMFDEIFVTGFTSLRAYAATVLRTELRKRCTLDVSHVRDGDDHFVIGIEIFRIELFRSIYDFRTTVVAVFFFHFNQLVLDDLLAEFLVAQNFFEVSDLLHQVFVFGMELILHQSGELAQAHFYDSTCLDFAQVEAGHQVRDSFVRSLGGTDNADYLVNVV